MTGTAITFLLLSVLLVWGGLVLSIIRLRREGEELESAPDDGDPRERPSEAGGDLR